MTDTRERFLQEITARVPADRIAEVHLFRPLRRGATETGVAVIAAERTDAHRAFGAPPESTDAPPASDAAADLPVADETALASAPANADDGPYADDDLAPRAPHADTPLPAIAHPERHTVFTARYRLTIKGAERGKWEFDVVADADAPLVTVDTVVRGVQRRAGDDEEPERLTADGLRAALDGQSWRAAT
jgi:hypothetical protein